MLSLPKERLRLQEEMLEEEEMMEELNIPNKLFASNYDEESPEPSRPGKDLEKIENFSISPSENQIRAKIQEFEQHSNKAATSPPEREEEDLEDIRMMLPKIASI